MTVEAMLIGLDGATYDVLDPLMDAGKMPNLKAILERGARGPLRTVMPPLTPPGWTSMMTGQKPGRHGVFDFFQKEAADSEYFRLSNALDIKTDTMWSTASAYGKRVISLNFPQMFPPPAVDGYVVPGGWMPWRQLRLGCHPRGLFDQLKELPSFNPKEISLDMELEAKAIEGCPDDEYADWIQLHIRRERRWVEILRFLLAEDPSVSLVGVVFDGVDKLQHLVWRFLDPSCRPEQPTQWEAEITVLCEEYFTQLDGLIGELIEMAGPQATIVFASDHGFGASQDIFYVNTWLEQNGYLAWSEGAAAAVDTDKVGFSEMTRHIHTLDWDKTLAYAATPSSQGINIVTKKPGSSEPMPEAMSAEIRDRLVAELSEVVFPETGVAVAEQIFTREQGFAGPFQDLAPDVSLTLNQGAAISIVRSENLFKHRDLPRGHHRWDGIFGAAGPNVRKGKTVDDTHITDILPLLMAGLGIPAPEGIDGSLPRQVLTPVALARTPAPAPVPDEVPVAAAAAPAPIGSAPADAPVEEVDLNVYDEEDEATILGRLRTLGYVE
jgi:predicted AlkP superfamily phosphohydrolase/phosphomutase